MRHLVHKLKNWPLFVRVWLVLAFITTILSLLVYTSVQQVYRQSANDPQIEIASNVVDGLNLAVTPDKIIGNANFDLGKSLSPVVIIYDDSKKVLASAGKLDGSVPTPPQGVFDHVTVDHQNRLTWQPKPGVRLATIIAKYDKGYVLVSRSLRETEDRVQKLGTMVGLAWIISILGTLIVSFLLL
jgi:hypothetical protein